MADGNFDTHFSLDNMLKDSKFALHLAKEKGLFTPGIDTTSQQMQSLSNQGYGDLDYSALYKQFDSWITTSQANTQSFPTEHFSS